MEEKKSKEKQLPSFPSNYVTLVELQERWLKEKQQKEQEKVAAQKIPSNYVTLVQLQERWLKEKQQKEQEKVAAQKIESNSGSLGRGYWSHNGKEKREVLVSEMEIGDGGGDGADHVGEGGEEKKKNNGKEKREVLVSEMEIGNGGGDGANHVGEGGEEKKKKKKWNNKNNKKKLKGKKLELREEEEAPLGNAEEEEKTRSARGKSRDSSINGDKEVVVSALLVNGEKEGDGNSKRRNQGSKSRIKSKIGARASSVNGEKVEKEVVVETPLANGEKERVSEKRMNRKKRENRGETRQESNGLDQNRASFVNGEKVEKEAVVETPLAKGEKERVSEKRRNFERRENRGETRQESNGLDQNRALLVNGKKIYARVETRVPRKEALLKAPLNLKEDVLKTMGESRKESNFLDQTADVEPKFRALSVNDGIEDEDDGGGEGLRRTSTHHNQGYMESRSHGSGRFGYQGLRNSKDAGMVWVKKEDVFDGNGCGAQKPGSRHAVSGFGRSTKRKGRGSVADRNHETLLVQGKRRYAPVPQP